MAGTGKGWWAEEGAGQDVIRSIEYMNAQELRTSTTDFAANQAVIDLDPATFLPGGSSDAGGVGKGRVQGIEYIDESLVSIGDFCSRFVAPSRPCMIRGACEAWPSQERWASPEALVRWRGNIPIRVTEQKDHPSAKAKPLRIPLKHYCSYAMSNTAAFPWYGFDDDLTGEREALFQDFSVPSYFVDDCYDISEEARHVFPKNCFFIVGGARTGTGLHVDPNCTSAWNSLLCGRKRWVLFPPGSDEAYKQLLGVQEEYSRKVSQPCKWWREDHGRILRDLAEDVSAGQGAIECIQEAGDTIFVPAGWWHAVLNLEMTIAITANPLLPASLHSEWADLAAACPPSFLARFAAQCAERWPDHVLCDSEEIRGGPISQELLAMARGAGGEGEVQGGGDFDELRALVADKGRKAEGCVLFIDFDGVFKPGDGGGLRAESLMALQELVNLTDAELVLTSACRAAEVSRQAVREALNRYLSIHSNPLRRNSRAVASGLELPSDASRLRWGLDFSRWVTTGDLPGGRSSQILDFVTKQLKEQSWAVVDSEGVGKSGGLMMEMLLHSKCVVAGQHEGFSVGRAIEVAKILMDLDDEDEDEA